MSELIVGRDRAHVRSLLSQWPGHEIISASAFFDRVRLIPFLYDLKLKRDDLAPAVFAHNLLGSSKAFSRHLAKNFVTLYSSLFHGTMCPKEAYATAKHEHLSETLKIAALIDQAMEEHHLVNGTKALFKAWHLIKEKGLLPPALAKTPRLSLHHLIDLTALEIEIVKALSLVGLEVSVIFPLDFKRRAINIAVDFAARQFEMAEDLPHLNLRFDNLASNGPLKPLIEALLVDESSLVVDDQHCTIDLFTSIDEESAHIADAICTIKATAPAATIAVAFRTFDARTLLYKADLLAYGLDVRDRKGEPLASSAAGLLLKALFLARHYRLRRQDLIGLVNHPLFVVARDGLDELNIGALLDDLGMSDAFLLTSDKGCRYESALDRWLKTMSDNERELQRGERFRKLVAAINALLSNVPLKATWADFLDGVLRLLKSAMPEEDQQAQVLLKLITALHKSASLSLDHLIDFNDLEAMLWAELSSATLAPVDHSETQAVEILLLPELLGRSFDHVFIPDISFGRLPKSLNVDPLLSDEQRLLLNKMLGRAVLRVYLDDPFEPVGLPSRQALEPFWFAGAIASAQKSVHLSCARYNEEGAEQAPSEFFVWLLEHVEIKRSLVKSEPFVSHEQVHFCQGQHERLVGSASVFFKALSERHAAFQDGHVSRFAFSMDQERLRESFGGRLNDKPTRVLTPTLIEAFAHCRFHGWLVRMVGLMPAVQDAFDVDARILGRIAHQALERFFAHPPSLPNSAESLKKIMNALLVDHINNHFVESLDIFNCYMEWLYDNLLALVQRLLEEGYGRPLAQEEPFGLARNDRRPALVKANDANYLLGGVIDRVDRLGQDLIVMDYKLSRTDRLRELINEKAMLKNNFQIPIYLRLARSAFTKNEQDPLYFVYASIRDRALVSLKLDEFKSDLSLRIFDDQHEQSMARAIDTIFAPVKSGSVIATISDQCSMCDFSYVCRKGEGALHD